MCGETEIVWMTDEVLLDAHTCSRVSKVYI
jgi:hypothetical protein